MSLVPSSLVSASSAPTGPENLWDPGDLLRADWSSGVEITTSWPGSSGIGITAAEKRVAGSGKPLRTLRFTIKALEHSTREPWRLKNLMRRFGICRLITPLWPDASWSTAAITSGATSITCDTSNRRLFTGGRIVIACQDNGSIFGLYETAVIASVASGSIALAAGTANAYPVGSRIAPLVECDVIAESSPKRLPGGKLQMDLIARECPGIAALPPLAVFGATTAYGSFGGYPVFDPGFNPNLEWLAATDGWNRLNTAAKLGLGTIYNLLGPRPRYAATRKARAMTRGDAWNILTFFDVCQGPLRPFYAPAPLPLIQPSAVSSTTVSVPAAGPLEDWNDYPLLAVVTKTNGTSAAILAGISSVARASGVDTLTLASSIGAITLGQVWYCVPANLVRFAGEDIVEKWSTSGFAGLDYGLIECLNEGPIVFTGGGVGEGGGTSGDGGTSVPPFSCGSLPPFADGITPGVASVTEIINSYTDAVFGVYNNFVNATAGPAFGGGANTGLVNATGSAQAELALLASRSSFGEDAAGGCVLYCGGISNSLEPYNSDVVPTPAGDCTGSGGLSIGDWDLFIYSPTGSSNWYWAIIDSASTGDYADVPIAPGTLTLSMAGRLTGTLVSNFDLSSGAPYYVGGGANLPYTGSLTIVLT
jgi:hypothetical protein